MIDFASASLDELLREGGHACACGRTHTTGLKYLKIGRGAVRQVTDALQFLGKKKPFIVSDVNTDRAAGRAVRALLDAAGIAYAAVQYPEAWGHIEPDERAVGALTMAWDATCDVVLAVGSGVVNDCCKVLAHAAGVPSMVVGTAPSMDGYASNSSSMVVDNIKTSIYTACPAAIIADVDIMKDAPMRMLWAGLGDMLAKYNALCEWKISHIVTGEFYCENIAQLVRRSVKKVADNAGKLASRAPEAVEAVVEGLILSGVAMDYAKVSRPASGVEHYFSHMWEMDALTRGEHSDLHGICVGVGLCLTLPLYGRLRAFTPSREVAERAMRAFDEAAWETEMRGIFGPIAESVIRLEKERFHKNDPAKHAARLERILGNWEGILRAAEEEIPDAEGIVAMMRETGMPTTPEELELGERDVHNAFIGSREIRDKYLLSSLLWDLGVLHGFMY